MGRCSGCGGRAVFLMDECSTCIDAGLQQRRAAGVRPSEEPVARRQSAATVGIVPAASLPNAAVRTTPHAGSESACMALGAILAVLGFFDLIVSPTEEGNVVNLQRLYLGQTAAICGAVFLAAGLRPRQA